MVEKTIDSPVHVSDDNFEETVLKSSLPVIVDFWAPWCGPCHMVAPILDDIAREYAGKLIVAKVNTDENPVWAGRYGVQGIPTLLYLNRGEVVDRQVGAASWRILQAKVDALLKSAELASA